MVDHSTLREQGGRDGLHQLHARPRGAAWVAENILYKVPNKAAMDALDPALLQQYPNLAMPPAELIKFEQLRDVGPAQKAYSRAVSEIMAAQVKAQ